MEQDPPEYRTRLVSLASEGIMTTIWFMEPLDYEAAAVSPQLAHDLKAWDAAHDAGDGSARWQDEGRRLARQLARELGPEFDIELETRHDASGACVLERFTSDSPATNPAALARFRVIREEARAEDESWMRPRGEHPGADHRQASDERA
jgi:hypothetical protein